MATENQTADVSLYDVAHAQTNQLHDVLVLLDALEDRINDMDSISAQTTPEERSEKVDNAYRLAHMARVKVESALDALHVHI